jgi:FtsP/CotA-like multicopper oxidase with cupredoxin domain
LRATARTEEDTTRQTVDLLKITTTGAGTPTGLPATLNTITALDTTNANTRTITPAAGPGPGTLSINGASGTSLQAMQDNMIMVGLDDIEVWDVVNTTGVYHVFHLHDVPFQVMAIGDADRREPGLERHRRGAAAHDGDDRHAVHRLHRHEYMYMLHCHNLIHEDAGMMLALMVM